MRGRLDVICDFVSYALIYRPWKKSNYFLRPLRFSTANTRTTYIYMYVSHHRTWYRRRVPYLVCDFLCQRRTEKYRLSNLNTWIDLLTHCSTLRERSIKQCEYSKYTEMLRINWVSLIEIKIYLPSNIILPITLKHMINIAYNNFNGRKEYHETVVYFFSKLFSLFCRKLRDKYTNNLAMLKCCRFIQGARRGLSGASSSKWITLVIGQQSFSFIF